MVVGVSAVWMCRVPFLPGKHREVGEPLFFEPLSRGLPGIEKGALKGFRIARFSPGMVERTAWTLSKETHENLSNWTLPSSACVTVLDISLE